MVSNLEVSSYIAANFANLKNKGGQGPPFYAPPLSAFSQQA
jgi:hypothetical protein